MEIALLLLATNCSAKSLLQKTTATTLLLKSAAVALLAIASWSFVLFCSAAAINPILRALP